MRKLEMPPEFYSAYMKEGLVAFFPNLTRVLKIYMTLPNEYWR